MLNSIGSAPERRARAQDTIRTLKQGSRTPSELLDALKDCWDEIEEDREIFKIDEFVARLNWNLLQRLSLSESPYLSLQDAEDRAMRHYRIMTEPAAPRSRIIDAVDTRDRSRGQKRRAEDKDRPAVAKRANSANPTPGDGSHAQTEIICYSYEKPSYKSF